MVALTQGACTVGTASLHSNGWWVGERPMQSALPLFSTQLIVVTCTSRALRVLLSPLMMPRINIDIMASLLLGPSFLGRLAPGVRQALFQPFGDVVLNSVGNLGLVYWFFLLGIQLNAGSVIKKIGKQAAVLGMAPIFCTCILASAITSAVNSVAPPSLRCNTKPLFIGTLIAPPCTAVLASMVVQHKVLHETFAKVAMNAAVCSHLTLAVLSNLLLALAPVPGHPLVPLWRVIIGVVFIVIMFGLAELVLKPIRNEPKDIYMWWIMLATAFISMVTDMLGLQITSGAFLCGFVMPSGLLAATFTKKMEDFTVLLAPLVLVKYGQAIDLEAVFEGFHNGWGLVIVLVLTYAAKQVVVACIARYYSLPFRDGFLVGALLSTKGIVDTLMLGWEAIMRTGEKLDMQSFATMLCAILVINLVISLTIRLLQPETASRPLVAHDKCRAVQHLRSDAPFRILACLHDHRMVPTLISLLEATQATAKSPIKLSALRLLRTTGREAAMVHGAAVCTANKAEFEPVHVAFRCHQWINENVIVEHRTRISSYNTMHQDINDLAIENSAAMVIIPFHKQLSEANHEQSSNAGIFRSINLNVLADAPCSVGILVNKGLLRTSTNSFQNVAVLFFGGPDDREALAYATRMAKQGVKLTVVRFLPNPQATKPTLGSLIDDDRSVRTEDFQDIRPFAMADGDRERVVDDYCISLFQTEVAGKKMTVSYVERMVTSGPETMAALREMDPTHDLFVVGRRQETGSWGAASGMEDWNEYPELGLIGDFLASPDFAAESVLVVQQYVWRRSDHGGSNGNVKLITEIPSCSSSSKENPTKNLIKDLAWRWDLRAAL